jgi:hypothetical protein
MRARLLLSLALVLALAGIAAAEKTKVAVLGLEVAGSIDGESTSFGRRLTEMLRAKVNQSPRFMLAANSLKDLLDEKLANSCETEANTCMAVIGGKLKTQFLVYGKLEKRQKDGKDGYQFSMTSLDVDAKTDKKWGDWIPYSDFADGGLDARVQRGFETLLGKDAGTTGTTGTIGITNPPPPPPPKKGGGFPWKPTAYVSGGLAIAAIGGSVYFGPLKAGKLDSNCHPINKDAPLDKASSYDPSAITGGYSPSDCAKGPKYSTYSYVALGTAAVLGGLAVFAFYESSKSTKESPTQVGKSTRKKKQFAVTPILSPDGAGATVRLDW